jgi:hypothetical protein
LKMVACVRLSFDRQPSHETFLALAILSQMIAVCLRCKFPFRKQPGSPVTINVTTVQRAPHPVNMKWDIHDTKHEFKHACCAGFGSNFVSSIVRSSSNQNC